MIRRRHEEKCTGQPHQCKFCHSILHSKQALQNHEVSCRNSIQEKRTEIRGKRTAELDARLHNQQETQIHEDDEIEHNHTSKKKRKFRDSVEDDTACSQCGEHHCVLHRFTCRQCRKNFGNVKSYQRHRQIHFKRKAPRCECHVCHKTHSTRQALAQHIQQEHTEDVIPSKSQMFTCCDCDESFDAHHKLYAHRMKHSHATSHRLDDPYMKMPWEKDETVLPPWVAIDEEGNRVTDDLFKHAYMENRDTIQSSHDLGIVRGVYNFPVNDYNGEVVIMRSHIDHILRQETHAFKVNIAFGLILRNIETGEYRYYTPYYNSTILEHPFRINRASDVNELMRELERYTSLDHLMKDRESTKWQKVFISNINYFVYRMGYPIGTRTNKREFHKVPLYISQNRAIITLDTNQWNRQPYKDNLCAFRCIAWSTGGRTRLEKRTKENYNKWRAYQEDQGITDLPGNARRYQGIYYQDLPDFEKCFEVRIQVYSLNEDLSCCRIYQSIFSAVDDVNKTIFLNLFERHFSLITDFSMYAKKYACSFCKRLFTRKNKWILHEKICNNRVAYKFPGGIYSPSLSIFEEIQQTLGLEVESELQYFPWFAVYDFESVLKPTNTHINMGDNENHVHHNANDNTKWVTSHIPVAVSISSNVEGYTEPNCIVNDDPDKLVELMCEYLEKIQSKVCTLAKNRWSVLYAELKQKKNEFPTSHITDETMEKHNSKDPEIFDPETQHNVQNNMEYNESYCEEHNDEGDEINLDTGEENEIILDMEEDTNPDIGGMEYQDARNLHASRVENLILRFEKYASVIPVLGFNSAKYDLNLIKKYFPKHMKLTTDCDYVVKKTNQYTTIVTSKFKFLDIINYLAAGCNYSKFLRAYDIKESKSYFPYEWFDDIEKLKYEKLPHYEAFFSKLKNDNVLQVEYTEWEKLGSRGTPPLTGIQKYNELLQVWDQNNMTKFEDFLQYYANLDTGPFVQAAVKLQQYYFDMGVDVFKVAISAPGVARRLLFKYARANNKYFASFEEEHQDLFYKFKKCAAGGPSIIFKRYAKVGETKIRNNHEKICRSIAGYDCNALYLYALSVELPVLFPIRRKEETGYKPEVTWKHLEMYQWLNWRSETDGVHIQHKLNSGKEFPVGPYLLDGFASVTTETGEMKSRGYEFNGCWTHGHDPAVCGFNRDIDGTPKFSTSQETLISQEKKRKHTLDKEKYIRSRNIDLEVIYECVFAALKKKPQKYNNTVVNCFRIFTCRILSLLHVNKY